MFTLNDKYTDEEGKKFSGICFRVPDFTEYENYFVEYIINSKEEYKVNEIAYKLYGDEKLSWVLDEINHAFSASFYAHGETINYLPYKYLLELGI